MRHDCSRLLTTTLASIALFLQPIAAARADEVDTSLRALIARHQLTGDPSTGRVLPTISAPLSQLGLTLFFSTDLSGAGDVSCATCHQPTLGGTDHLRLPIGANAKDPNVVGPGRERKDGYITLPRNSPTTFNVAFWDSVLFHDGRVESLGKTPRRGGNDGKGIRTPDVKHGLADPEAGDDLVAAQARFPVVTTEEMRARHVSGVPAERVRRDLVQRLQDSAEWRRLFAQNFGDTPISFALVARALSSYERSQVFVNTPWKRYVEGDVQSLPLAAKRGAKLFFSPTDAGGAGCISCHRGDFFTDEQFHILAVPQIGPGRYDGGLGREDHGRYTEHQEPRNMYAFRTPSLLNVELTAPYGHSGAFETLTEIVRHHLNPTESVARFDPTKIPPSIDIGYWKVNSMKALSELAWARAYGWTPLKDQALSTTQVSDLVAFLQSLTDDCAKKPECLAPWMPPRGAQDVQPPT